MFDSKQTLTNRLADAADLLIDFATLGEYGLEPVGRTAQSCEAGRRPPAARQPRDRQCAPAPGKSAIPTTFSTVPTDSPYYEILCGSRHRLQNSPAPTAARRPGPQGKAPRIRALRDARI